ncbi:single-strand DNA endonuclease ASTE1 [Oryctolagus cuniculus]|uniref:single-strand DNA endonuclease ASTE1 n=1 Tax=Oryctolagus cuniculus TaxID=9986 RepID=UPI003879F896
MGTLRRERQAVSAPCGLPRGGLEHLARGDTDKRMIFSPRRLFKTFCFRHAGERIPGGIRNTFFCGDGSDPGRDRVQRSKESGEPRAYGGTQFALPFPISTFPGRSGCYRLPGTGFPVTSLGDFRSRLSGFGAWRASCRFAWKGCCSGEGADPRAASVPIQRSKPMKPLSLCLVTHGESKRQRKRFQLVLPEDIDPCEALDNVLNYLPKKDRESVKELLCCSMEEYQQSQVKLQDFFQYGSYVCPDALNLGLPEWILVALARGQLPPFISDALVLRRTILHTQVENMQRPNAHRVSQPIRQIIYGLLLNASPHLRDAAWQASPPQPVAFREVERIHRNITTSVVDAVDPLKDRSDLSTLTEVPGLPQPASDRMGAPKDAVT